MVHMTPEDLRTCGLSRKGDGVLDGAGRVLGVFAKMGLAFWQSGPVSAILTARTEVNKMAEKSDYKRSDFHYESCSSPFCNGCKSYTGES